MLIYIFKTYTFLKVSKEKVKNANFDKLGNRTLVLGFLCILFPPNFYYLTVFYLNTYERLLLVNIYQNDLSRQDDPHCIRNGVKFFLSSSFSLAPSSLFGSGIGILFTYPCPPHQFPLTYSCCPKK